MIKESQREIYNTGNIWHVQMKVIHEKLSLRELFAGRYLGCRATGVQGSEVVRQKELLLPLGQKGVGGGAVHGNSICMSHSWKVALMETDLWLKNLANLR